MGSWQTAESKRKRALEAAAIIRHLQEFAHSPDNLSGLSELFTSDERLAEAAVSQPGLELGPSPACQSQLHGGPVDAGSGWPSV